MLQPILRGKKLEISRLPDYSKVNSLEKSTSFKEGGVEKGNGILAVIYKKELARRYLYETPSMKRWHKICLYFYMVIMA